MFGRIDIVDTACQNRDGSCAQASLMRCSIDATGQPRDNGKASTSQFACKLFGDLEACGRRKP